MGDKNISAIPEHLTMQLEGDILEGLKLDQLHARLDANLSGEPRLNLSSDLFEKMSANLTLDGTLLERINAGLGLTASVKELAPLLLTLLWTEIPIIKLRVPHDYTFGFSLFGIEFFAMHFRGESKAITAKNPAGPSGGIDG